MRRRTVLRSVGAVAGGSAAGFAGCLTRDDDDDEEPEPDDGDPEPDDPDHDGTLRVATYRSMVEGTAPAGPWLVDAFEETYPDADLEWVVPETGIEHFVQRAVHDAEIDVDVCFGFTVGDLARIDDGVGEGALLRELNTDRIEGVDRIRDDLEADDPHGRALAFDAGYVALVYDETEVDPPDTFADLLDPALDGTLLAQHPGISMPGQAFFLWAIEAAGPDDAIEFWEGLAENGVRIHRSWSGAYEDDYLEGERPMVVSYSTDPVFAETEGLDPDRHRVAFPDGEGYAVPEGMGIFEAATEPDLAYAFLEFVLREDVQAELARRNVQFPAVDDVDLDPAFESVARRPPEPVTTGYTELRGGIDDWIGEWTERFDDHLVERPEPPDESE